MSESEAASAAPVPAAAIGSGEGIDFPPELDRFNLAAFALPWVWYFANGLWQLGVLFVVGPVLVGAVATAIFFGHVHGLAYFVTLWLIRDVGWVVLSAVVAWRANRLAWIRGAHSRGVESYVAAQRRWDQWAVVAMVAFVAVEGAAVGVGQYLAILSAVR